MPPVLEPSSPSKTRLSSCAHPGGTAVSPAESAKSAASSPCSKIIDDAGAQRRLRPNHDKIDFLLLAKRDHRGVVGGIERHEFAFARDAGIARRAIEPLDQRARRHLPGERMLAPAGAEKENVHARAGGWCPDSEVRKPLRHPLMRTSESKGHQQIYESSAVL